MDKKLTDSEIVKGLEDTLHRIKGAEHLIVPKLGVENLCNGLENALDLINRLQEDLDNLIQNDLPRCKDALRRANEMGMELQAENERLKESLNIELENYATEYDNKIKAEAYKECIDMVKKKGVKVGVDEICIFEGTLDNLLKEMAGK